MAHQNLDLHSNIFTPREYQLELLQAAIERNVVICYGSGSGKTFVTVMLIKELSYLIRREWKRNKRKYTIFITGTAIPMAQQAAYIERLTDLSVGICTVADQAKEKWDTELSERQVLVLEGQTCVSLLEDDVLSLTDINLLVLDECHNALSEQHPIKQITDYLELYPRSLQPRILALTPSLLNKSSEPYVLENSVRSLEKTLHCAAETASDIASILRLSTGCEEKVVECNEPLDQLDLTQEIRMMVESLQDFLTDHVYDLGLTYGDEFKEIYQDFPSPTKEPLSILEEFLFVLEQMGPWCANRAALHFLFETEKLKKRTPHERHFLLLCLVHTKMVQIRAICENTFQNYSDSEALMKYSTPKLQKLVEILAQYKVPSSTQATTSNGCDCKVKIQEGCDSLCSECLVTAAATTTPSLPDDLGAQGCESIGSPNEPDVNLKNCDNGTTRNATCLEKPCAKCGRVFSLDDGRTDHPGDERKCSSTIVKEPENEMTADKVTERTVSEFDSDTGCEANVASEESALLVESSNCSLKEKDRSDGEEMIDHARLKDSAVSTDENNCQTGLEDSTVMAISREEEVVNTYESFNKTGLEDSSAAAVSLEERIVEAVSREEAAVSPDENGTSDPGGSESDADYESCVEELEDVDATDGDASRYGTPLCSTPCGEEPAPQSTDGPCTCKKDDCTKCQVGKSSGRQREGRKTYYNPEDPNSLSCIIFVHERITAKILYHFLREASSKLDNMDFMNPQYSVAPQHDAETEPRESDLERRKQEEVLRKFRMRECNVLVANSILEEGVDIPKVTMVVRFDPPLTYKSYIHSRGRVRSSDSYYILMATHNQLPTFIPKLAEFHVVGQKILSKCRYRETPVDEEVSYDVANTTFPPYTTCLDASVSMATSLALINRYCAKLPSDTFTRLTPIWSVEEVYSGCYRCSLRLPINSPVKAPLLGPPMPSRALAKMAAAIKMCEYLHQEGELDDSLLPVGKEGVRGPHAYPTLGPPESDLQLPEGTPRPGTTKRRQYYYKRISSSLCNCTPLFHSTSYLYRISMKLTCPIPEELNTRGRRIFHPEHAYQCFGILTSKPIPKLSQFPIFTRSGEVGISLDLMNSTELVSEEKVSKLSRFHSYLFSEVLRLEKYPMQYNPSASDFSFLVTPLRKDQGKTYPDHIDWEFVDLIARMRCFKPRPLQDVDRKDFKFSGEKFQDAVVMPWYRNQDQPQYFYVAEIVSRLNPKSDFPDEEFETFQQYYLSKYSIQIQNLEQPLLDVDLTSARLNLLTPRYVNRKGVALPTCSEATKRAKRESLQQKVILVPELVTIHPFSASLWRQAVCLPCILYRINSLLIADGIRRTVALEIGLGKIEPGEDHTWSPLDFGWNLAEVLKKKIQKDKEKQEKREKEKLELLGAAKEEKAGVNIDESKDEQDIKSTEKCAESETGKNTKEKDTDVSKKDTEDKESGKHSRNEEESERAHPQSDVRNADKLTEGFDKGNEDAVRRTENTDEGTKDAVKGTTEDADKLTEGYDKGSEDAVRRTENTDKGTEDAVIGTEDADKLTDQGNEDTVRITEDTHERSEDAVKGTESADKLTESYDKGNEDTVRIAEDTDEGTEDAVKETEDDDGEAQNVDKETEGTDFGIKETGDTDKETEDTVKECDGGEDADKETEDAVNECDGGEDADKESEDTDEETENAIKDSEYAVKSGEFAGKGIEDIYKGTEEKKDDCKDTVCSSKHVTGTEGKETETINEVTNDQKCIKRNITQVDTDSQNQVKCDREQLKTKASDGELKNKASEEINIQEPEYHELQSKSAKMSEELHERQSEELNNKEDEFRNLAINKEEVIKEPNDKELISALQLKEVEVPKELSGEEVKSCVQFTNIEMEMSKDLSCQRLEPSGIFKEKETEELYKMSLLDKNKEDELQYKVSGGLEKAGANDNSFKSESDGSILTTSCSKVEGKDQTISGRISHLEDIIVNNIYKESASSIINIPKSEQYRCISVTRSNKSDYTESSPNSSKDVSIEEEIENTHQSELDNELSGNLRNVSNESVRNCKRWYNSESKSKSEVCSEDVTIKKKNGFELSEDSANCEEPNSSVESKKLEKHNENAECERNEENENSDTEYVKGDGTKEDGEILESTCKKRDDYPRSSKEASNKIGKLETIKENPEERVEFQKDSTSNAKVGCDRKDAKRDSPSEKCESSEECKKQSSDSDKQVPRNEGNGKVNGWPNIDRDGLNRDMVEIGTWSNDMWSNEDLLDEFDPNVALPYNLTVLNNLDDPELSRINENATWPVGENKDELPKFRYGSPSNFQDMAWEFDVQVDKDSKRPQRGPSGNFNYPYHNMPGMDPMDFEFASDSDSDNDEDGYCYNDFETRLGMKIEFLGDNTAEAIDTNPREEIHEDYGLMFVDRDEPLAWEHEEDDDTLGEKCKLEVEEETMRIFQSDKIFRANTEVHFRDYIQTSQDKTRTVSDGETQSTERCCERDIQVELKKESVEVSSAGASTSETVVEMEAIGDEACKDYTVDGNIEGSGTKIDDREAARLTRSTDSVVNEEFFTAVENENDLKENTWCPEDEENDVFYEISDITHVFQEETIASKLDVEENSEVFVASNIVSVDEREDESEVDISSPNLVTQSSIVGGLESNTEESQTYLVCNMGAVQEYGGHVKNTEVVAALPESVNNSSANDVSLYNEIITQKSNSDIQNMKPIFVSNKVVTKENENLEVGLASTVKENESEFKDMVLASDAHHVEKNNDNLEVSVTSTVKGNESELKDIVIASHTYHVEENKVGKETAFLHEMEDGTNETGVCFTSNAVDVQKYRSNDKNIDFEFHGSALPAEESNVDILKATEDFIISERTMIPEDIKEVHGNIFCVQTSRSNNIIFEKATVQDYCKDIDSNFTFNTTLLQSNRDNVDEKDIFSNTAVVNNKDIVSVSEEDSQQKYMHNFKENEMEFSSITPLQEDAEEIIHLDLHPDAPPTEATVYNIKEAREYIVSCSDLFPPEQCRRCIACGKNTSPISYDSNLEASANLTFSFDEQPDLRTHPGPGPSVILQALTMSNANDGINLERLETIGDSFLKYAITTYLYCAYPDVHEGKLSYLRSKQVSNLNLYRLGKLKKLGEGMVATKFEPHDNWLPPGYFVPKELEQALIESGVPTVHWNMAELPDFRTLPREEIKKVVQEKGQEILSRASGEANPSEVVLSLNPTELPSFIPYNLLTQHSIPDKSIADCVEALIGAYLTSCGQRGALLLMCWLNIYVLPDLRDTPIGTHNTCQECWNETHGALTKHSSMESGVFESLSQNPSSCDDASSDNSNTRDSPLNSVKSHTLQDEGLSDTSSSNRESPVGFGKSRSSSENYKLKDSSPENQGSCSDDEQTKRPRYGYLLPPPSPLLKIVPDPYEQLNQSLDGYEEFERTINYRFQDRSYILQAFTHASYYPNRLTDCYQRLEFLGDAVLDYLITRHLYEDARKHSPGALTDLRSALVNNTIFASLAVKYEFHKFFKHLSPGLFTVVDRFVASQILNGHQINEEYYLMEEEECEEAEDIEVPKALGDVFESVAGAIFLDSGMSLDAVWRVYYRMMKNEIEEFSSNVPKSPIRELLELEPETAKFGKPERLLDGKRVRVTVEVFGKGTFKGIGRNYRIAKSTAAKCALRSLKRKGLISQDAPTRPY